MNYSMIVINKQGEIVYETNPYNGDSKTALRDLNLAAERWENRGYEVEFRERKGKSNE